MKTKKLLAAGLSILLLMQTVCISGISAIALEEETDQTPEVQYYSMSELYPDYTPINTVDDLEKIRKNPNGKFYLTNDITFSPDDFTEGGKLYNEGKGWTPIEDFSGTIDGLNHNIDGLVIKMNGVSDSDWGFINKSTGTICNLGIDVNIDITDMEYYTFVSIIAGYNKGVIDNCVASGNITINDDKIDDLCFVAGITADNWGTVSRCMNNTVISCNQDVEYNLMCGGITARNVSGSLSNCINYGKITCNSQNNISGISALSNINITNCCNCGSLISSKTTYGITKCTKDTTIPNCYYLENTASKALDADSSIDEKFLLTVDEFRNPESYISWDFNHTFKMDETLNTPVIDRDSVANLLKIPVMDGNGSINNPFIITCKEQLWYIGHNPSKCYKLANDIILTDDDYAPAGLFCFNGYGWGGQTENAFTGTFDGNDFKISGLQVNKYKPDNEGILSANNQYGNAATVFKYNRGTIKNTKFEDIDITLQGASNQKIGVICAINYGTISNCTVSGNCNFNKPTDTYDEDTHIYIGGICAENRNSILNCSSDINFKNTSDEKSFFILGGISAENVGKISHCYNTGSIDIQDTKSLICGGICATCYGSINQCYNSGDFSYLKEKNNTCAIGGISGMISSDKTIANCFNTGTIIDIGNDEIPTDSYMGGICGSCTDSGNLDIENCYNSGTIFGMNNVGPMTTTSPIAGQYTKANQFKNCYYIRTNYDLYYDIFELLSVEDMKNPEKLIGFDFENTWEYTDGDYKYPVLKDVPIKGKECITSIRITKLPDKTTCQINQNPNFTGLQAESVTNSGVTKPIYGYKCFNDQNATLGKSLVTVIWSPNSDLQKKINACNTIEDLDNLDDSDFFNFYLTFFEIEITPKPIEKIEIYKGPKQTSYTIDDDINIEGLRITVTYVDGSDEIKKVTEEMLSAYSFATCGKKTITVNYYGKSATFTVNVYKSPARCTIQYNTHVEDIGWQEYVSDGQKSGTTGLAKRLEGIHILIEGNSNLGVTYSTHVEDIGWQNFVSNGNLAGTTGQAKRLEAIKIKLTGSDASKYNVYYRVHVADYGWLGWAKNGAAAGTEGYAKRLESIQIKIVLKDENIENSLDPFKSSKGLIQYNTHVEDIGWQDYVCDGSIGGTTGQAKRLEAIHLSLNSNLPSGDIVYRTHVQDIGWMGTVRNGEMSGTSGQAKRLEAIQIALTGEIANQYDVYYRAHAESYGWLGWASNGEPAGTAGFGYRLEAIQVILVPKGSSAPVGAKYSFIQKI